MGEPDPDGGYRIALKPKDLIIRGGGNIPSRKAKQYLSLHPKAVEVQAAGLRQRQLGRHRTRIGW